MKTTVAALACLFATGIAGCADHRASVEIAAICAPPDDASKCGQAGKCGAYLGSPRPWVYTMFGALNELQLFIEFDNQLPNNADADVNRVNTNDYILDEYLFTYTGVPGLSDVRYPANATIFASSASAPVVPVIPFTTMAQITTAMPAGAMGVVIVEMKARGHFLDGTTLETGPFPIAVDVINANFPGYAACTNATDVRFLCPNGGQTASSKCAAP